MHLLYVALFIALISTSCVICVLTFVIAQFVLGGNLCSKDTKHALTGRTEEKKGIVELTEEQKREMRKKQIELQNFMNYSGDVMPDPNEKKYESTANKGD